MVMRLWIKEVQHLRGVAILAVIMIHTTAYFTHAASIDGLVTAAAAVDVFSHYANPLLIFASGLALSATYSGPIQKGVFYRRRLKTIIPPYLIFSTFCIIAIWLWSGVAPSPEVVAYDYLTGSAFYHLWFIPLIIQFYLLFPYLIGFYERRLAKMRLRKLLAAFLAVQLSYVIVMIFLTPAGDHPTAHYLAGLPFIGFFAYFVAGIYVGRNLERFRQWVKSQKILPVALLAAIVTAAITALTLDGIQQFGSYAEVHPSHLVPIALLEPVLYLSVFVLFFRWASSKGNWVTETLGRYSLWAYLTQSILIFLEIELLDRFGITFESWFFYPTVFGSTVCMILLSTVVLRRIPHGWIIGAPSAREMMKEKNLATEETKGAL